MPSQENLIIAGSKTGPHTQRERSNETKRQSMPDWEVAVLKRKGTYIRTLSGVAAR